MSSMIKGKRSISLREDGAKDLIPRLIEVVLGCFPHAFTGVSS